ncbi:MAG: hypothetical protein V3V49_09680 [Candidatus Krumholzibacteria bacterium]
MTLRTVVAGSALLMLLAVAGCGGNAARGGDKDDGTVTVIGQLSRRGGTPFSMVLLQARDGMSYWIQSTALGDELRQLVGMEVAVTGRLVRNDEGENILMVQYYYLLRLPSGEKPVVGIVRTRSGGPVWVFDDNNVHWSLQGDFVDVLRSFAGAKVWVTGVVQKKLNVGQGAVRTLLVTEYGVIRP